MGELQPLCLSLQRNTRRWAGYSDVNVDDVYNTLLEKKQHPQYSFALVNSLALVCILRGCSVYNSFFTVIGEQMTLRRPVFAPCFVTLQAVTVVL